MGVSSEINAAEHNRYGVPVVNEKKTREKKKKRKMVYKKKREENRIWMKTIQ